MKINTWPAVKEVEDFFFFHELYIDWMVLHIDLYLFCQMYFCFLSLQWKRALHPLTVSGHTKRRKKCQWKTKVQSITLSMCMIKWRNIYHKYKFISWISLCNTISMQYNLIQIDWRGDTDSFRNAKNHYRGFVNKTQSKVLGWTQMYGVL